MSRLFALVVLACFSAGPGQLSGQQGTPEIASQDSSATFKAKVNLVSVPVVVRDREGRAIGNLKQEDFQLFDKGKPQVISKFSIEKTGARAAEAASSGGSAANASNEEDGNVAALPQRFIVYLFDDLHLDFGDLGQARQAALEHLSTLQPSDRAAIASTSGQTQVDFTDDRDKLQQGLTKLMPRPLNVARGTECPDLSYYQADLIQNKNDQQALQGATAEVLVCENIPQTEMSMAQSEAKSAAMRVVNIGEHDTLLALGVIEDIVRRVAAMPGQRTIVLVSPGFITPDAMALERLTDILDRATRASVIISALDARGLYTTSADASQKSISLYATQVKQQYDREAALEQEQVMGELADGTGGTFFHNSNDLKDGFRRVATAPEYVYVLGFSPQNLKFDGRFHPLKVTVKSAGVATLQARRGYYAPKRTESEAETAKRQIEDAVFSRDEMHDLPVDLHTQFFKTSDVDAKLTVLAHVDVRGLHFEKVDGRNRNDLTVVSALFDRNGNFIAGQEKTLQMRLRDETLGKLSSGITVRSSFDTKTGSYFVRLVVRDTNGQLMAAENGSVEIP
jgi:VWFA-related protein